MNVIAKQVSDRIQIIESSIVLVANDVNVSIFKLGWMLENNIVSAEELDGEVSVTDLTVLLKTKSFELTVVPNRIQMNIRPVDLVTDASSENALVRILRVLPHTPVSAIGLNVTYMLSPPSTSDFVTWNKSQFAPSLPLDFVSTEQDNARFGTYVSWNVFGARLRIDIKPITAKHNDGSDLEFMRAGFNYHTELPSVSATEAAVAVIEKWHEVVAHSTDVARSICYDQGN